jgi:hypothetical protein
VRVDLRLRVLDEGLVDLSCCGRISDVTAYPVVAVAGADGDVDGPNQFASIEGAIGERAAGKGDPMASRGGAQGEVRMVEASRRVEPGRDVGG